MFLLLVSRKKFVCQHSSFRKVSREENKKGNSKNANCLASVTCVVKLDTHSTRKVDPYIKVWSFLYFSYYLFKYIIKILT